MSHESVISDLKLMMKMELISVPPDEHVEQLQGESDRSMIILEAAALEATLVGTMKDKMPTLNGDEKARIFGFEGPCGSFSNRIRIAQGLGLFDRPLRRKIEVIKELRNVAAHCHSPINFDVPQIRNAVASLFSSEAQQDIRTWSGEAVRLLFSYVNMAIICAIIPGVNDDLTIQSAYERVAAARRGTSRGRSSAA